jgi:hypothetical protein
MVQHPPQPAPRNNPSGEAPQPSLLPGLRHPPLNHFTAPTIAVPTTAIQTRIPQPRLKSHTQRYLTVRPDISGGLASGPKGLDDTEGSLQY